MLYASMLFRDYQAEAEAEAEASINDTVIVEADRRLFWTAPGPRPADHPGILKVR